MASRKEALNRRQLLLGTLGLAAAARVRAAQEMAAPERLAFPEGVEPRKLERSYWLHATLGASVQRGYWGADYPVTRVPTDAEVRNAARMLTGSYGANRLYLIYHREVPIADFLRVLAAWRKECPRAVELVPTLVLRMYDAATTPVFSPTELDELCQGMRHLLGRHAGAVYDVLPNRSQGEGLEILARRYAGQLQRVGLQPGEALRAVYGSGGGYLERAVPRAFHRGLAIARIWPRDAAPLGARTQRRSGAHRMGPGGRRLGLQRDQTR